MKVAYVDASSGIAGDMTIAALSDAGAPLSSISELYEKIELRGLSVTTQGVFRCGVAARHLLIDYDGPDPSLSRSQIEGYLTHPMVPKGVSEMAGLAFHGIVEAERVAHQLSDRDEMHLHEIGNVDTVIDLLGVFFSLELLEVERVYFSSVAVGSGFVRTSHGITPNPAPVTERLLIGKRVEKRSTNLELTTPTGASIVYAISNSSYIGGQVDLVEYQLRSVGYGAGSKDPESFANVLSVHIGEAKSGSTGHDVVAVTETYLDDLTPEVLASLVDDALLAGAVDGWLQSCVGKKSRPGFHVTVLWKPEDLEVGVGWLHRRTGSLGVRYRLCPRSVLSRSFTSVDVSGMEIRVKVNDFGVKAEFEDVLVASRALGMTTQSIAALAESKALSATD